MPAPRRVRATPGEAEENNVFISIPVKQKTEKRSLNIDYRKQSSNKLRPL